MQVLRIISMKTKDDLKIGNINIKSITDNKIRLENYQEAFEYTEKDVSKLYKESQHIIKIKIN